MIVTKKYVNKTKNIFLNINPGTIVSFIDKKNFPICRFFNQLLLPRVRDDIDEYQRLNYHLYQALRKALFKPGAFFKGK
jgi:hypothetical protein